MHFAHKLPNISLSTSVILFAFALLNAGLAFAIRHEVALRELRLKISDAILVPTSVPASSPPGELFVTYAREMQVDQEPLLEFTFKMRQPYTASKSKTKRDEASIAVSTSNLALRPEPTTYKFDLERLAKTFSDSHNWFVTATRDGNFNLIIRPKGIVADIYINQRRVNSDTAEYILPVTVYTPWMSRAGAAAFAQYAGPIISFLLTLPILSVLLKSYLERKRGASPGSLET